MCKSFGILSCGYVVNPGNEMSLGIDSKHSLAGPDGVDDETKETST